MKHLKPFLLAGAFALLPVSGSFAQTGLSPAARPAREGNVVLSDGQAADNNVKADAALSREVRERLARIEKIRQEYRREQERLLNALRGAATEAERELIREKIRASREAWMDRLRAFREELKDRLPDLRRRLPELNEVLDNARNNARDSVNAVRKRRGQD